MAGRPDPAPTAPQAGDSTLVLHGGRDPLPAEGAAELARLLPSARLEILPGVGHTPWLEDAAMVRQALRRFINAMPMG